MVEDVSGLLGTLSFFSLIPQVQFLQEMLFGRIMAMN
jgi:hypothetical protein